MRKAVKIYLILFGILGALIGSASISALFKTGTIEFLSGNDCLDAHNSNYIREETNINYQGYADIGETLDFSIVFQGAKTGIIFSVDSLLMIDSSVLNLYSGDIEQSRLTFEKQDFTVSWQISGLQNGSFTVEIHTTISVKYPSAHSSYVASYEYINFGSFTVLDGMTENPNPFSPNPSDSSANSSEFNRDQLLKNLGQILGFISILSIYLVIQLGMPDRKTWIRKKFKLSASKIREYHCNLGYFSVVSIWLHLIFLSLTNSWGNYIQWYSLFPQFLAIQEEWSLLFIGLDLAAFGGVIFLISTIAGRYFKLIARKLGYKRAILTQQISYLALIFAVLHSIFNGSWTGEYLILAILQSLLLAEILISRGLMFLSKRKKQKIIVNNQRIKIAGEHK